MQSGPKNIIYFGVVIVATAIILTALFFYNKGNTKELNAKLKISDQVTLDLDKATSRPLDSAKNHLILYVKAHNDSDQSVDLRQKPLTDPCVNVKNSTNNYYTPQPSQPYRTPTAFTTVTPTPSAENNYQTCIQGEAYKTYQQNLKSYQDSFKNPTAIELWTPQNQKCEIDQSYSINQRYPNIGSQITTYYDAKQSRVGTLVYSCPEKVGEFSLKYNNETVKFEL